DLGVAERTAKACSLLPGVFENPKKLVELADLAVTRQPAHPARAWFCLTRGLVEYRAGRPAGAVPWLEQSLAGDPAAYVKASARYLLAMTQQQRGQTREATLTLAQAQKITRRLPPLADSGRDWQDWVINDLLRCEAEALIAGKSDRGPGRA